MVHTVAILGGEFFSQLFKSSKYFGMGRGLLVCENKGVNYLPVGWEGGSSVAACHCPLEVITVLQKSVESSEFQCCYRLAAEEMSLLLFFANSSIQFRIWQTLDSISSAVLLANS